MLLAPCHVVGIPAVACVPAVVNFPAVANVSAVAGDPAIAVVPALVVVLINLTFRLQYQAIVPFFIGLVNFFDFGLSNFRPVDFRN